MKFILGFLCCFVIVGTIAYFNVSSCEIRRIQAEDDAKTYKDSMIKYRSLYQECATKHAVQEVRFPEEEWINLPD